MNIRNGHKKAKALYDRACVSGAIGFCGKTRVLEVIARREK